MSFDDLGSIFVEYMASIDHKTDAASVLSAVAALENLVAQFPDRFQGSFRLTHVYFSVAKSVVCEKLGSRIVPAIASVYQPLSNQASLAYITSHLMQEIAQAAPSMIQWWVDQPDDIDDKIRLSMYGARDVLEISIPFPGRECFISWLIRLEELHTEQKQFLAVQDLTDC